MKHKSPRNQTLMCHKEEIDRLSGHIRYVDNLVGMKDIREKIICGDTFDVAKKTCPGVLSISLF